MSRALIPLSLVVGLLWLGFVPSAFLTLYSVLELQTAAKAAGTGDSKLAKFRTVALAERVSAADAARERSDELLAEKDNALQALFQARNDMRVAAISVLTAHQVEGATNLCTAPDDELKQCQIDRQLDHCQIDHRLIQSCTERATALARRGNERANLKLLDERAQAARDLGFEYNRKASAATRAEMRASGFKDLEKDPLYPIAESLRLMPLPMFRLLFMTPEGIVIALFTGLMGFISAGVSSLAISVRRRHSSRPPAEYVLRAFLATPAIGALAGFMVYFVVAAGATFLTQPVAGESSQVSNLSVPALASLGVFAGLAAESAIDWLREKAASFFASPEGRLPNGNGAAGLEEPEGTAKPRTPPRRRGA